jgi:hypothetical protein
VAARKVAKEMKVPHATKDPEDSDDTHVEHEIDGDVHLFLNESQK